MMEYGNAHMNAFVVSCLELTREHRILEVGFGSGWVLRKLVEENQCEYVAGVELSHTMLERARARFFEVIRQGRLELFHANVSSLPFDGGTFDRVCTVNTLYFWDDPLAGLLEISRVLRPAGRLTLGLRPAASLRALPFTRHGYRIYENEQVMDFLELAGFAQVEFRYNQDRHPGCVCAIATKM